ncbi:lysylphosphatidylglycerol synthase transmembrane domain-containing protein [Bosea vestrisii]|uniref:lysylphosphatidylglycerol synthase transmembrane domain-containing protein n=1 Tax=Bosea vestrisii TaxID=151416 RepID=UPI0024E01290|nr:lysylphosphatidylglycerol synthase transmembrane domain-containing protein [Bosea vestrisii]WID98758.1 lysylphosphatidylglycerol synthase transmembrane domain-containing protein [Bosea vestrisii]
MKGTQADAVRGAAVTQLDAPELKPEQAAVKPTRPWKRRAVTLAYYLLIAVIVIAVVRFGRDNWNTIEIILNKPLWLWMLAALLYLMLLVFRGLWFDILAVALGGHMPLKDSVALTASGLLGNYFLPGNMALPLRSLYLQRLQGISYKRFIPIAIAAAMFSIGVVGVVVGLIALWLGPVASKPYTVVVSLFGFGGVGVILLLVLPFPFGRLPFIGSFVEKALAGWRVLISSPRLLGRWQLIEIGRASTDILFFWVVAQMFDLPITLGQAAIITMVKDCAVFFRLTPGGFGVAEGVQAFFALAFGLDVSRIIMIGLACRVIEIACLAVVSGLLVPGLKRKIGNPAETR